MVAKGRRGFRAIKIDFGRHDLREIYYLQTMSHAPRRAFRGDVSEYYFLHTMSEVGRGVRECYYLERIRRVDRRRDVGTSDNGTIYKG